DVTRRAADPPENLPTPLPTRRPPKLGRARQVELVELREVEVSLGDLLEHAIAVGIVDADAPSVASKPAVPRRAGVELLGAADRDPGEAVPLGLLIHRG